MTPLLLFLTPLLPLALALALVPHRYRTAVAPLLPLAPVPALAAAIFAEPGVVAQARFVLLGVELGLDATRRPLLAMTGLLWLAGGIYVRGYLAHDLKRFRFAALYGLTMAGNLGLIVALDVPSFYAFFSLMTLASYVLVVFDQTQTAYRAGRVYIVLSLVGETALLFGLVRAVAASGELAVAAIPGALTGDAASWPTLLLLIVGFGIKAGLFPLHVWLPLAHAAAPTPGSAVLSGAMIKAGLLGLLLFLPLGEHRLPAGGAALAVIGLFTAFYGVAAGLGQSKPKTVLAYSSLSQMGIMTSGVGAALIDPVAAPMLVVATVIYAVQHGFAKGALFFSVSLAPRGAVAFHVAMAGAVLGSLAIAGAPLTGGAVAKLLVKDRMGVATLGDLGPWITGLLTLTAAATTMLMARFLVVLRRHYLEEEAPPQGAAWRWGPFLGVLAASQAAPWMLAAGAPTAAGTPPLSAIGLWESLWPVALGAAAVLAVSAWARRRPLRFVVPEGDIYVRFPSIDAVERVRYWAPKPYLRQLREGRRRALALLGRVADAMAAVDGGLAGGPAPAVALGGVAIGLAAVLLVG